ncbi:MAG: UDP-3-O-(3-hydroxymyristoyl)glucosamine N-acyltransferase [Pseudomonadota bacterium]
MTLSRARSFSPMTLGRLAEALGLDAEGDLGLPIRGAAHPAAAGPEDLAVATDRKHQRLLGEGGARAALLDADADREALGLAGALRAPRPRFALALLTETFARAPAPAEARVHPSAVIHPEARIAEDAWIGPFCVIGAGARIGPRARLLSHVCVGDRAVLGADVALHPGVRIGMDVRLGDRVAAHPNAVIGSDGFSYVTPEPGAVEAAKSRGVSDVEGAAATVHARIHSLGAVEIGADVEIGAGATLDRGTLRDTVVGAGTKIDNLVQIAHNVRVGRDCLICAQAGVAGSAEIGDRVVLGGKAGVADHSVIGSDVLIAASSGLSGKVPPRTIMMGTPALPRDEFYRLTMALRRLPRILDKLRQSG